MGTNFYFFFMSNFPNVLTKSVSCVSKQFRLSKDVRENKAVKANMQPVLILHYNR